MKKGFTLLEMIIVVTIISILFLLTVPNIQKVIKVVDEKGCDAQIKVVDSAILEYRLETGNNPGSINELISAGYLSSDQAKCNNNAAISISNGQAYAQ